ncbi:MAG: hypothetical protein ACE5MI_08970 [Acidimicrobiia bacterium]
MSTTAFWDAVKWPILSWVVADVVVLIVSYVDGVVDMLTAAALTPVIVAFGVWTGYKVVELGGNYSSAIIGGAVVGVVCGLLIYLGLGGIRGLGLSDMWPMAVFGFAFNIVGALIGGGFALTKATVPTTAGS